MDAQQQHEERMQAARQGRMEALRAGDHEAAQWWLEQGLAELNRFEENE